MSKGFFGQKEADIIFNELGSLDLDLDEDPLAYGPKRLNNKIAQVRGMLSRCERVFLDVAQQLHRMRRQLKVGTLNLELAKKHLFATDPETRAGRSVADREAIASGKLHDEVMKVHDLEMATESLTAVLLVVKAKRADLKDIESRLRDQHRLCGEEIGLGARWGSKAIGDFDLKPGIADQAQITGMKDMLDGVDAEINLGSIEETEPEETEETEETVEVEEVAGENEADTITNLINDIEAGVIGVEEIEKQLAPTVSKDETDAFLNMSIVDTPKKTPAKANPPLNDDGIESILATFEKE